jgi:hypothetical protein
MPDHANMGERKLGMGRREQTEIDEWIVFDFAFGFFGPCFSEAPVVGKENLVVVVGHVRRRREGGKEGRELECGRSGWVSRRCQG